MHGPLNLRGPGDCEYPVIAQALVHVGQAIPYRVWLYLDQQAQDDGDTHPWTIWDNHDNTGDTYATLDEALVQWRTLVGIAVLDCEEAP
jgi:hypothetical protein